MKTDDASCLNVLAVLVHDNFFEMLLFHYFFVHLQFAPFLLCAVAAALKRLSVA